MLSIYFLYLLCFPILALYRFGKASQNTKRNSLLTKEDTQYLKGLSACFVILAHMVEWLSETERMNSLFHFIFGQFGGVGVLIFFFVSGYGIYESYGEKILPANYLWKRIGSVYLPYLLIKFVFLVWGSITGLEKFSVKRWLSVVSMQEEWFVQVIMLQYIIVFIIGKCCKWKLAWLISMLADCILSFFFILENRPIGWHNALWLFTVGMVCSQYKENLISFYQKWTVAKIMVLLGLFVMFGLFFAVYKGAFWVNPMKVLAGVALCIAVCGIFQKYKFRSACMLWLGKMSLYMYVVHVNVWRTIYLENIICKCWMMIILTLIGSEMVFQLVQLSKKWKDNLLFHNKM